jgi:pimeloyl-ACP methyl ester carboxylesterase
MKSGVMSLLLICLLSLCASAQEKAAGNEENKVENGTIEGAPFRIDVPANWNKTLVMYCHGYVPAGVPPNINDPRLSLMRNAFVSRGFAFAQSGYRVQGWAVKEAVEDTELLRSHFVTKYGKPNETYIMGHSMGAVITLATIEKYPEIYHGALPLCGPLNEIASGFQERIFGMLVTFDFLFPGTMGPLVNVPKGTRLDRNKIKTAVDAAPEKAASFAKRFSIATVAELPNVLGFFYEINREIQERAGGNPFDNRNIIYDGFDDNVALNRGVKRYSADPKAREYLRLYYTPTGRISDPVLTMHTTYDNLIPGRYVSQYDSTARNAGTNDLFVTKFIVASGHCNFTIPQIITAFEDLITWVRERKRPEPGESK